MVYLLDDALKLLFIFDFSAENTNFVEGSEEALKTPNNAIIPLSLARKLFGSESAIGKQLFISNAGASLTVGAVFRDFPPNSIFENCIYTQILEAQYGGWDSASWCMYILVNDPAVVPTLYENFSRNYDLTSINSSHWLKDFYLDFTALADIHYAKNVDFDDTPKSSKQSLFILLSIAIVILIIAAINFTNFSTALAPMRIKSINTQFVLGARRSTLRRAITSEAVILSFLSFFVAVLLVFIFSKTQMARLVDGNLSLSANPFILVGTALAALFTGLLAGVYPARYMTSFSPAIVLKGSFGLSPKGKSLRNTLIGIQFIASFALIIGASFMYLQNYFMQNAPLGYDKDNLLTVDIRTIRENREAITNELKTYPGIDAVTYGTNLMATSDLYSQWSFIFKEETIWTQVFMVNYDFLKVMNIKVTEGRDFRQDDARPFLIFNDVTRKQFNLELNETSTNGIEIIGFIPDIKYASFRTEVRPMAFMSYPQAMSPSGAHLSNAYIKLKAGANLRDAVSHISAILKKFDADYIFNIRFFDETLQKLYEKERALNSLITLFSFISIFISIVGVFGLVVFESECRRKEVGIRKIFGASIIEIIVMFNKAYFRILLICFVVAAPLAWYAVHHWLENFAYKTPMYWWVYLLAFIAVGIITACTVTFQNWRVASDNPVKAIKTE